MIGAEQGGRQCHANLALVRIGGEHLAQERDRGTVLALRHEQACKLIGNLHIAGIARMGSGQNLGGARHIAQGGADAGAGEPGFSQLRIHGRGLLEGRFRRRPVATWSWRARRSPFAFREIGARRIGFAQFGEDLGERRAVGLRHRIADRRQFHRRRKSHRSDRIGEERCQSLDAIGRSGLPLQTSAGRTYQIALIRQERAKLREIGRRHLIRNLPRRRRPPPPAAAIERNRDKLVLGRGSSPLPRPFAKASP